MKLFIFFVLFSAYATLAFALSDYCEYNYCVNDELHVCEESDSKGRVACNNKNGLFVTYRASSVSLFSSHKCCLNWRIDQLAGKYLYCVRNIRDEKRKCTSQKADSFVFKFVTKCKDHAFSCM